MKSLSYDGLARFSSQKQFLGCFFVNLLRHRKAKPVLMAVVFIITLFSLACTDILKVPISKRFQFTIHGLNLNNTESTIIETQGDNFEQFAPTTNIDFRPNSTLEDDSRLKHSFHLLIPASERNLHLCKTLLSASVLDYPPPTLINWGKSLDFATPAAAHAAKIRGIYDYLSNNKEIQDNDLVLIVDGYDVWFQLPPDLLIKRYHSIVETANARLRSRYGTKPEKFRWKISHSEPKPKFEQSVVYGADKLCWPNQPREPACRAVPSSTLPKNFYGMYTDRHPDGHLNRPRFLNSGTVIGPARNLKAIYKFATQKVEKEGKGAFGDQFVFAEIFGEQESQRESLRTASQSIGGRLVDWLGRFSFSWDDHMWSNNTYTLKPMTVVEGQRYEFGLGLDYESQIFQTMTRSHWDIAFLHFNDSAFLSHVSVEHNLTSHLPLQLPSDIEQSDPPIRPPQSNATTDLQSTIPTNARLDSLPKNESWSTVPLATNLHVSTIPALLHFNGDKSYLDSWWSKMWYKPYGRALLRNAMRLPQGPIAASAALSGGQSWFDLRGGRGGMWTDGGLYLDWTDMCRGWESEIFGDGKGVWFKEEGGVKVYNSWGKLVSGEEDEEDEEEN